MAKKLLPPNVTVSDIVDKLGDADTYLSRSLNNLRVEVKIEPGSRLTIGRTGNGSYPNYKIDVPVELKLDNDDDGIPMNIGPPRKAFSGRTHRIFTDPNKIKDENWSGSTIDFDTLEILLKKERKLKVV